MEQSFQNSIAVVGAGPSGCYCALWLLKLLKENNISNFKLTLFDKSQILRTILPTGNGRCNLTNAEYDLETFISNYPRGNKFLYSIFSKHNNFDSIDFFNSICLETYVQDDLRVFPKSNSARDVKNKILNEIKKYKNVSLINKDIKSADELFDFNYIVVAAGSKGTDNLIKSFKHNLVPFRKALCALNIKNNIYPKGVSVKSLDGDFIFTDLGISGPLAFKLSSINVDKTYPYEISINLFNSDDLINETNLNGKKAIGNLVSKFIPKSLAQILVKDFNKKAAEVSKSTLISYSKLNLTIDSPANTGEIVRAGGVDLNELTNNCKSKIKENLWFCGEILDIDGFTGGFNLQNCWSSAFVVANDIVKAIMKA